jgi:hypothetical protein
MKTGLHCRPVLFSVAFGFDGYAIGATNGRNKGLHPILLHMRIFIINIAAFPVP